MTFYPDQGFAAERLRNTFFGSHRCSGRGTWQFTDSGGDTGPSLTTYKSGDQIAVFSSVPATGVESRGSGCTSFGFGLITWRTNGTLGLCMDFDPGSPCTGEVYIKQVYIKRVYIKHGGG